MMMLSSENKILYFGLATLLLYFLSMDIMLYQTIQLKVIGGVKLPKPKDYTPTPFTDLTVKLACSDHWVHFVYMPSAELFESSTNFSGHFPWVTANMVSFTHLATAIISGKFMLSDDLNMRRMGIFFFYIRNWLDAFDGVVYRAHAHKKHYFESVRGSLGYLVDAITDTAATAILFFAVLFWLRRNVSRLCKESSVLPFDSKIGLTENGIGLKPMPQVVTGKIIFFKLLTIGIFIFLSSGCWDKFVHEYEVLLMGPEATAQQQVLQSDVLKSSAMWMIIWIWKIICAQGFIEIFLIIIIFDKVWEFICWMQYIYPVVVIVFCVITEIHLHSSMAYIGHVSVPTKKS